MAGVVGSRRDLIFVISELYYEVGGKIAGCRHILTGWDDWYILFLNPHLDFVMISPNPVYLGNGS